MARSIREKHDDRPLVVSVDTSTLTLSVVLSRGPDLVGRVTLALPRGHSRALLSTIVHLVEQCGHTMEAVDAFAIGQGPGSFTGLRIGLALMKSLSLAYQKPLYGGSSLAAAAADVVNQEGDWVCVCVDARKGEVYTSFFQAGAVTAEGSTPTAGSEEVVLPPKELGELAMFCVPGDQPILFVGTGAVVYENNIREIFGSRARFTDPTRGLPDALYLGRLANAAILANEAVPTLATLEPRYIRPSEAELGAK